MDQEPPGGASRDELRFSGLQRALLVPYAGFSALVFVVLIPASMVWRSLLRGELPSPAYVAVYLVVLVAVVAIRWRLTPDVVLTLDGDTLELRRDDGSALVGGGVEPVRIPWRDVTGITVADEWWGRRVRLETAPGFAYLNCVRSWRVLPEPEFESRVERLRSAWAASRHPAPRVDPADGTT